MPGIIENHPLVSVDGLANLRDVGSEVVIVQNPVLGDIRGLARMGPRVGEFSISENDANLILTV